MFEKELELIFNRCLAAHEQAFDGADSEEEWLKKLPQMEEYFLELILSDVIPEFDEESIDEFKEWVEENIEGDWSSENNLKFLALFILKWKLEAMILKEAENE
ncbi:MAG TPA: hypothetical protein P5098_02065 [Candidatus Dojkabacteria bacterium]|nr:hypothetical protein [Candidatus Dojkabacteria bacterium]